MTRWQFLLFHQLGVHFGLVLFENHIDDIDWLVAVIDGAHPLYRIIVQLPVVVFYQVNAYAVKPKTLRTRLLSVDFRRDLQHFLVKFWQVVLLQNPVNPLQNLFE